MLHISLVQRDDSGNPTSIKSEESKSKQTHTKREANPRLSLTQVWEHDSDGQRYIPRPSPARRKLEDVVDALVRPLRLYTLISATSQ